MVYNSWLWLLLARGLLALLALLGCYRLWGLAMAKAKLYPLRGCWQSGCCWLSVCWLYNATKGLLGLLAYGLLSSTNP